MAEASKKDSETPTKELFSLSLNNDDVTRTSHNDVIKLSGDDVAPVLDDVDIKNRSMRARKRGKDIFDKYYNDSSFIQFPKLSLIGGKEKFLSAFKRLYELMLSDPFMNVLFDESNPDTNVSAKEHGDRLGLMLLLRQTGDREYVKLRGNQIFERLEDAHSRAKNCPMRGKLRGKDFTYHQVYTWLGYLLEGTEHAGFPDVTGLQLVQNVASGPLHFYAPFHED